MDRTGLIVKEAAFSVTERREDGGRIIISTGQPDRAHDRVNPTGGRIANYMSNPVVQWGHNYADPWATVGNTLSLETASEGVISDFKLRPAANDADPQNIVRLLWAGSWIKTASVGFVPLEQVPNDLGGVDYVSWELLEWSLVPVPMNPGALALAMKGMGAMLELREGRVLSARNRELITGAVDAMRAAVKALGALLDDTDPGKDAEPVTAAIPEPGATEVELLPSGVMLALSRLVTAMRGE
jgi:hypothetical protein